VLTHYLSSLWEIYLFFSSHFFFSPLRPRELQDVLSKYSFSPLSGGFFDRISISIEFLLSLSIPRITLFPYFVFEGKALYPPHRFPSLLPGIAILVTFVGVEYKRLPPIPNSIRRRSFPLLITRCFSAYSSSPQLPSSLAHSPLPIQENFIPSSISRTPYPY